MGIYPKEEPSNIVEPIEQAIPEASVVIIGSSVTRNAVPGIGVGITGGILGDYRTHVRLAVDSMDEEQSLYLLSRVLKKSVEVVFLEINPFSLDFSVQISKPNDSMSLLSIMKIIKKWSGNVGENANMILGRYQSPRPRNLIEDDNKLSDSFTIRPNMERNYPLYLRSPRYSERLSHLLEEAKNKEIKVIFIALPRAKWAETYIGASEADELEAHYRKLAKEFGVSLFAPAKFWKNEHFIDSAHMNHIGRKRFLKELLSWWKKKNASRSHLSDPL